MVLEAFSAEQPEWGIRDLARKVGLNASTVFRIVSTLHAAGYLEQGPETQRYSLGPKVMKLAGLFRLHNSITTIADRTFESYTDRFHHNFYLGKLCEYEVIYLSTLDGRGPIRIAIEPGGSIELHTTALGKVLLAYQTDEYVQGFLNSHPLNAFTSRTITDPAVLWQQIREIRKQGYAINDGEHYEDIAAVATPVYDSLGQVTVGVSLAYPRHFIQKGRLDTNSLIQLAQEVAHEITLRSGGSDAKRLREAPYR